MLQYFINICYALKNVRLKMTDCDIANFICKYITSEHVIWMSGILFSLVLAAGSTGTELYNYLH